MTHRERWVVYPLLFMAIGFGMRNGIEIQAAHDAAEVGVLRCKELQVVNNDGKVVVQIKANGVDGAGFMKVANSQGLPQVMLGSNSMSGEVSILNHTGRVLFQAPPFEQRMLPSERATSPKDEPLDEQSDDRKSGR